MSSTPLAVVNKQEWTPEQMQLITDVVARGATQDELKLFLYRCTNMGLDPLKPGQVHFIKYGDGAGTIVVGIEGFRLIAERTGKKSGVKRGVIKEAGKLVGAWCEVYRSDWKEPAREEVPFGEYYKAARSGKPSPWDKMPETMIKKVAEAAALRMAFPDVLGGVYIREEMDQAESQATGGEKITPHGPPGEIEQCGVFDDSYRIPFGKYRTRSLEEVGPDDLASYVRYLEETAAKKGQTITGQVAEFIDHASAYIRAFDSAAAGR